MASPVMHRAAVPGRDHPPALVTAASDLGSYIRREDWAAFSVTAWWFGVHILVRRSNPASLAYIGRPGFVPKSAETKAKTAQRDVDRAAHGRPSQVAGLVCDPTRVGPAAYASPAKHESALKEWEKFRRSGRLDESIVFGADGVPTRPYLEAGRKFFVDTRADSPRFGALMQSRYGATHPNACAYVHGDYDLFAIVPADNPSQNIVVAEQHLASPWHDLSLGRAGGGTDPARRADEEIPNFRGKKFMDVQAMLNRRIGTPMILHGSQEKAVSHFEKDGVDVFLADGLHGFALPGAADLARFYEVNLGGRKLHNFMAGPAQGTLQSEAGTLWQSLGTPGGKGSLALEDIHGARWTIINAWP